MRIRWTLSYAPQYVRSSQLHLLKYIDKHHFLQLHRIQTLLYFSHLFPVSLQFIIFLEWQDLLQNCASAFINLSRNGNLGSHLTPSLANILPKNIQHSCQGSSNSWTVISVEWFLLVVVSLHTRLWIGGVARSWDC